MRLARSRHWIAVTLVAAIGLSCGAPTAAAHPPGDFFPPSGGNLPGLPTTWPFGQMDVVFTPSFSSSAGRLRVNEAHANWPQWTGRPPVYFWTTSADFDPGSGMALPDDYNGVHMRNLGSNAHALTITNEYFGHWNSQLVFNSVAVFGSWNYTNGAPLSSQVDLEGVATHEFGHMYGWRGHFGFLACPPYAAPRNTMCAGAPTPTDTYVL